jgi:hypothetical protein
MSLARLFGNSRSLGPYARGDRAYKQPPVLYRNAGGGRLEDATATSGDLARLRLSARGLAVGDLDGDGRADLVIASIMGGVHVLANATASGNALEILPVAGADRRTVLGTKVIVTSGGRRQVQEFVLRPSYASGAWVPLHFGLGAAATATVEVIPPGKTEPARTFGGVGAGRPSPPPAGVWGGGQAAPLYTLRDGTLTERRAFRR